MPSVSAGYIRGTTGLLLAVVVCVILPACATRSHVEDTSEPYRLRVMAYNIRHCRGMDNQVDAERIAAVINAVNPDLVSLQEVDVGVERSGRVDQPAEIGRLTGLHHQFGKARDFQGGDYGQAILSRWPITSFEVHELPGDTPNEERLGLLAGIAGEGQRPDILFVGTHLHHQAEAHRIKQATLLMEILRASPYEVQILTGDINARPGSPVVDLLLTEWEDTTPDEALTFPADTPDRKIDYILLPQGHNWRVVHAEVIDEPMASDHRPIIVDLEWR